MRLAALAALLSVVLATPCLARIADGDGLPAPKPALTVVDGSDASIPIGSTVLEGIQPGDAVNVGAGNMDAGMGRAIPGTDDRRAIAGRAATPPVAIAALK